MRFGENVKKLRMERNMSMEQLAAKISVPRATLSKWESGREYPAAENITKLSKVLQVPLRQLITEEDDMKMQHLLDDCVSRKYYYFSLLCLGLIVLFAGMTKVAFAPVFNVLTVLAFIGYIILSTYARPKYIRAEQARNKTADLISKVFIVVVMIIVVYCILML